MNMGKLNQSISLIANLGVLVGIFVLIYEIQQTNVIARAEIRNEIARSQIESAGMYQTPEALEIMSKSQSLEELDDVDKGWFRSAWRREFRSWENVHYQYRVGMFDENEMESYRYFWNLRAGDCSGIFDEFYNSIRLQLEPNFRAEMDDIFANAEC